MRMNRTVLMIVIGAILALVLWGLALLFTDGRTLPLVVPVPDVEKTAAITENYDLTPASLFSGSGNAAGFTVTGFAMPNVELTLSRAGQVIAHTSADTEGNWVLGFDLEDTVDVAELKLRSKAPTGETIPSDQSLVIVANRELPWLILLTGPGSRSSILQSPFGALPSTNGFALETIDYDNSGGVIFSGTSNRPGRVQIFANNQLLGESQIDPQGRWSLIFGNILLLGNYKISATLTPHDRTEAGQITLPFARMQPMFETEGNPPIVVERLNDRIQIGRALHGGGYQYTVIYAPTAKIE